MLPRTVFLVLAGEDEEDGAGEKREGFLASLLHDPF